MTRVQLLLCAVILSFASGCAARQAATTWGYSHWYQKFGGGSMGEFQQQQQRCLEQVGVEGDPASVAPNSSQENAFVECMNAGSWCTQAFDCEKVGAS